MQPTPSRPAALACDICRRKHLRCDGLSPCRRCSDEARPCTYTASRRGLFKRRKHTNETAQRLSPNATSSTSFEDVTFPRVSNSYALCLSFAGHNQMHQSYVSAAAPISGDPDAQSGQGALPRSTALLTPFGSVALPSDDGTDMDNAIAAASPSSLVERPSQDYTHPDEHTIDIFYTHFHPAHPFLVPRAAYHSQRYPAYLDSLVRRIANRYSKTFPQPTATQNLTWVDSILSMREQTVSHVQALLLAGIVLHADHAPRTAERCISLAMQIARDLGLNRPSFGQCCANDTAAGPTWQQRESWTRTWWELFTIDIYLAALHRRPRSPNEGPQIHPHLPSSKAEYEATSGSTSIPLSMQDLQDRVFLSEGEDVTFSSFCYRIEAAQILERVLTLIGIHDAHPDSVQAVDNALTAWHHHLPTSHAEVIHPSGDVDFILVQAHCLISCASIILHFPRSDLPLTVPTTARITGARAYRQLVPTSAQHTVKAIAASKELSNMAALPTDLGHHSPLFACALILAAVVQLAAASTHVHQCGFDCLQQHRDRIVLLFGVLKSLGERWKVAAHALDKLRPIARAILSPKSSTGREARLGEEGVENSAIAVTSMIPDPIDSGFASHGYQEDIPWFDLFEPSSITEAIIDL